MISDIVKFIEAQAAKQDQFETGENGEKINKNKYGRHKWNYAITSVIKQDRDGEQVIFHRCLIFRGLVLGGGVVYEGFSIDPDEAIKDAVRKATDEQNSLG